MKVAARLLSLPRRTFPPATFPRYQHLARFPCIARASSSRSSQRQDPDSLPASPSEAAHKLHAASRHAPEALVTVDGSILAKEGVPTVDLSPDGVSPPGDDGAQGPDGDDEIGLEKGKDGVVRGKLSSTSSKLLRLTLPLPSAERPVAFVLHPSQPLSYIARLIASEVKEEVGAVEFLGFGKAKDVRWSDATDIGDFIREAARVHSFSIRLLPPPSKSASLATPPAPIRTLEVLVPSFSARTFYARARLRSVNAELRGLGDLKILCDQEAHKGARRLAYAGLGGLLTYGAAVYWLTFQMENVGWDVMEPVTFCVSQAAVTSAYTWWLFHQREPSQTAVLSSSISSRQSKLYEAKGFDLSAYQDLTKEGEHLRAEIYRIAREYGRQWDERQDAHAPAEVKESEALQERAEREGSRLDPERSERKAEEREKRAREKKKRDGKDDDDD